MHVSIDFGFHKLVTVPLNRPGDSSLMVAKISGLTPFHQTTLLKSEPHKESSTLTGLGRGATPWVFLGLKLTWVMSFFIIFSQFPYVLSVSNGLWAVIQKFAAWTVSESIIFDGIEGWDKLEMLGQFEMEDQLPLARLREWEATVPLFISENMTWCGLHLQ